VATLEADCPSLKTIVYSRNYVESSQPAAMDAFRTQLEGSGLKILSVDEVVALGRAGANAAIPLSPPTPDHIALVMYTSGSTGKPKVSSARHVCYFYVRVIFFLRTVLVLSALVIFKNSPSPFPVHLSLLCRA
jgi:acyl-coenzyme A synthetase/AMP-(fatty) acid ligase